MFTQFMWPEVLELSQQVAMSVHNEKKVIIA